ncbi:hypothetical protein [Deinococcus misasensis]|uniref:hypothetical protein n=1 Tax=Deinococcus misasensis TaxID=392413 RepID=UPI00055962F3|nr:hypothetical protein [Deinococcus misasensis]
MKERPIMFGPEMVRAILSNAKTQTRRLAKPPKGTGFVWLTTRDSDVLTTYNCVKDATPNSRSLGEVRCRYGKVGDQLWVKEVLVRDEHQNWIYAADGAPIPVLPEQEYTNWIEKKAKNKVIEAMHMPHVFSRIQLEITAIWCEPLQNITQHDAFAEGMHALSQETTGKLFPEYAEQLKQFTLATEAYKKEHGSWELGKPPMPKPPIGPRARIRFQRFWNSLHTKHGVTWDANPFVWVVEFKRVNP